MPPQGPLSAVRLTDDPLNSLTEDLLNTRCGALVGAGGWWVGGGRRLVGGGAQWCGWVAGCVGWDGGCRGEGWRPSPPQRVAGQRLAIHCACVRQRLSALPPGVNFRVNKPPVGPQPSLKDIRAQQTPSPSPAPAQ
jgi:hypothetical protein